MNSSREKLEGVFRDLNGKVEVSNRLLNGSAIKTFLRTGDRTLVVTDLGRVDVFRGFPRCPPSRRSLDDLLAMKRASDRLRDKDDLEALEAAHGDEPGAAV